MLGLYVSITVRSIAPIRFNFIKESMVPKNDIPYSLAIFFFLSFLFVEQRSRMRFRLLLFFLHAREHRRPWLAITTSRKAGERQRVIFSMTEHRTVILFPFFFRKLVLGYRSYKPRDFGWRFPSPFSLLLTFSFSSPFLRRSPYPPW